MNTDSNRFQIAAIIGSLRAHSFNRALFRATQELVPSGVSISEVPIRDVPNFDQDLEAGDLPRSVANLRFAIAEADAVLFLTPEYNYSVPGVLKNAIDWASRPSGTSVLRSKPAAIMGAASGRSGTMRAQMHLRQILVSIGMPVLPNPEVYVTFASQHFDEDGNLIDEELRTLVTSQIEALVAWTNKLNGE